MSVHPRLEVSDAGNAVGEPGAALVEENQARELGERAVEA
jgi:hypothetical protein